MKKSDIVEFKQPKEDETGMKFLLLEDPDGGRVLAEAIVNMIIRPTYILLVAEIKISENDAA